MADMWGDGGMDFDLENIEEDLKRFQQDEVVKDALGQGVDLRQYARQIDADLRALQSASVPQFIEEAPTSAELYENLSECDEILESMERILQGFQADLGGISDEIRHLQDQSLSMSVKLKNRKQVENEISNVLERVVVSDALINGICQGDVNEEYLIYAKELDKKIEFVKMKDPVGFTDVAPSEILAVQEVEPQLERLRLKAVAKLRQFLLDHIADLKKPRTNVQIMQQNILLKYKYFVQFLASHDPAVSEEVKGTYVDTMSKILYTLFKSYFASLVKLQEPVPGKEDVIGIEEGNLNYSSKCYSSLFSGNGSELTAGKKLAHRENVLGEPDAPPIIVHVAKSANARFHFESIFRSVQKHLMDSATSEFLFILDFFDARNNDLFNQVFARTLSLCLEHIENYLYSCNDVVSLLLMIRTKQAHQLIMQRRKVPCLDGYFDHVKMLLWPTFKKVFNANVKSLREANFSRMGALTLTLKPHYVSSRYAEFSTIVHALSTSLSTSDNMLAVNLNNLRKAYLEFLQELIKVALQSKHHHRALESKKGQLVFHINNYDSVLSRFTDSALGEDINHFEDLLAHDSAIFIEEELSQAFPSIISFLKSIDNDGSGEESSSVDSTQLLSIVQEFAGNWKAGLEQLSSSVENYFPSPENARELLKQMLTQFLLYYTRFQDVVKKFGEQKTQSRLVSIREIMEEMKKYSRGQF